MLELRSVSKIYKTKGGAQVTALCDVSVAFEEKGMVFILGKSGSGKSTFLNICGGLDMPDSGELIVMGKSIKDFTAFDLDSYRNTFVGFVFQEYNILDEFSVAENIAMAQELQGKKKSAEEIDAILEKVDLKGYGKRKPRTLSGGQKQRLAIARALIKDPKIIMADEPTGALDSATGAQIMNVLKRLSQDKLVIVVSHDREYAERYADRIIELSDGKIVSDKVKTEKKAVQIDDNVCILDDGFLTVKNAQELSDDAAKSITEYIKKQEGEVIISADSRNNASIRRSQKIKDGYIERFEDIGAQPVQTAGEATFVRSRLPVGKAIKMGFSGMKNKPFRLIFTILLTSVTLIFFGIISSLMLFDTGKVAANAVEERGYTHIDIIKRSSDTSRNRSYGKEDVDALGEYIGVDSINIIYPFEANNYSYVNYTRTGDTREYYSNLHFGGFMVYNERDMERLNFRSAAPPGEPYIVRDEYGDDTINVPVLISEFTLKMFKEEGYYNPRTNTGKNISSIYDLLGLPIDDMSNGAQDVNFVVDGVFYGEEIPPEFENIEESDNARLKRDYGTYLTDQSLSTCYIINEAALQYRLWTHYPRMDLGSFYLVKPSFMDGYGLTYITRDGHVTDVNAIQSNQAYISIALLVNFIRDYTEHKEQYELEDKIYKANNETESFEYCDAETIASVVPRLFEILRNNFANSQRSGELDENYWYTGLTNDRVTQTGIELAGVVVPAVYRDLESRVAVVAENYVYPDTEYYEYDAGDIYGKSIFPTKELNEEQLKKLIFMENFDGGDNVLYFPENNTIEDVLIVGNGFKAAVRMFIGAGVAAAIFSGLMLWNFIASSITAKKKEIGILRAVGARGSDVFKIFSVESAVVVIICLIISLIASYFGCQILNDFVKETNSAIDFDVCIFDIENASIMIAIAVVVGFAGTFVPVYLISRKKPADVMK